MLDSVLQLDTTLLLAVNGFAGNPLMDRFMILVSSKLTWIPLYALLIVVFFRKLGLANTVWLCVAVGALVILTDQGSVWLFKQAFQRFRPCHSPDLQDLIILPSGKCGGQFGFISSHAANVFGLAVFVFRVLYASNKWWIFILFWASLVSFSRVYLGVHFPSDIAIGAIFGSCTGLCTATIFVKFTEK